MSISMSKLDRLSDEIRRLRAAKSFDEAADKVSAALRELETCDQHFALYLGALISWDRGLFDLAIQELNEAIKVAPKNPGYRDQHMIWVLLRKRYREAIASANMICEGRVDFSERFSDSAWFHMAYAYLQSRQWKKAETALKNVKDLQPIWIAGRFLRKDDLAQLIKAKTTVDN